MLSRQAAVVLRLSSRLAPGSQIVCQYGVASRTRLYESRRSYATPGRPKKAVGEPSRPVKRAVKKSAAKATSTEDSPAAGEVASRKAKVDKASAGSKKTARAPAGSKLAAKASATKKKKPVKKVLTEEQKAAAKLKAQRIAEKRTAVLAKATLAELKKAALEPPKVSNKAAYLSFMKEQKLEIPSGSSGADVRKAIGEHATIMGAKWKALSAGDIEHYNHIAHTQHESSQTELKRWVESHTVAEIADANAARAKLRRKDPIRKGRKVKWPAIRDQRAEPAKRAMTAYVGFVKNRAVSPDFHNIAGADRFRLIAQEWKALSEGEKQKYKELEQQDKERYVDGHVKTFGHPPPYAEATDQVAVAAGAA